jgi:thiamine kinase-like enzyme
MTQGLCRLPRSRVSPFATGILPRENRQIMETVSIEKDIKQEHIGQAYLMVSKVADYNGYRLQRIEKLPGGLTNENFKVTVGNTDYALRVAGKGTAAMINRPAEANNAGIMAEAGINPELFYYDSVTGDKIDKYIDGKTLHVPDFQTEEAPKYIKLIAKTLHEVHNSGKEFKGKFDFIDEFYSYVGLIEKNSIKVYDGHDKVMAKMTEIQTILEKNPRRQTPTHNDPLPENWIVKDDRIYLIDWEYGGIGDPIMDVAAFSLEVGLTEEQEQLLIREYFGREATPKEFAMILIDKFINDALWYLWAPIQIFNGKPADFYWGYGENRFNRAVELMNSEKFNHYLDILRN